MVIYDLEIGEFSEVASIVGYLVDSGFFEQ